MPAAKTWRELDLPGLKVEQDGPVAVVTLNRPDARNAFNYEMASSLQKIYPALDLDDSVKVVGNAFCAGADLSGGDFSTASNWNGEEAETDPASHRDEGGQCVLATLRVRKPTIAAITGHAVGVGATMLLPFDIRMAWKDAKVGFVFAQRGIVAEACSTYLLPRLIGHSRTMSLFMTARVLPASDPAFDLLWSTTHESPEATLKAALDLAHDIAKKNSAPSMAMIKHLVWRGANSPEEQHLLDSRAMFVLGNGEDSKEGVASLSVAARSNLADSTSKARRPADFKATVPSSMPVDIPPWWTEVDVRSPAVRAKL